ncbi:MAG TPA: MBL fold metallo-hydrolase [Polyangia bacterium]|nr:MBL fold metallo-hydrolase [Polyangia bacterium]
MPKIFLLECGRLATRDLFVRAGGSPWRRAEIPMNCALVERVDGLLLVDTGLGSAAARGGAHFPGRAYRWLLGARARLGEDAAARVRALGHDPRDVRDVLLTHGHPDHAGGLADFPWARVHLARLELAGFGRRLRGYHPGAWRHWVKWTPFDFEPDQASGFAGACDLLGDGSVVALHAPGHTPGHTIFQLRGARTTVFHLGDAAVTPHDYSGPTPRPNLFSRFIAADRRQMRATMALIGKLRRRHPDAVLVAAHDPAVLGENARAGTYFF